MQFNMISVRILVRKDYGAYFDFCTKQLGLIPEFGDRNGPYTNFVKKTGEQPCFAIFWGAATSMWKGYEQPPECAPPDTIAAIISTKDFAGDFERLKAAGIEFLGEPQNVWGFTCAYFRDPEGNLFELADGHI